MKISKCKKELARIISENGGWRNGEFAAQDGDGGVGGYEIKPEWDSLAKYWWRGASGQWFFVNKIKNHHQAVLSRDEYFHLYPVPDADGWIEWNGVSRPIDGSALVEVRLSNPPAGNIDRIRRADEFNWMSGFGDDGEIIAYRLHKPEQAKPELRRSVVQPITEPEIQSEIMVIAQVDDIDVVESKLTLDQLLQDWRNADDFAKRKQAEADEAAAMRDERWSAVQVRAGEMGVTVGLCESVAAEPELVADSIAWDDLFEGDEMLCVIPFGGAVNEGSVGKVRHKAEGKITVDFPEQRDYVYYRSNFERGDVKFIRRP